MRGPGGRSLGDRVGAWLGRCAALLGDADFVIRHRPGSRTTVRGRLPRAKVGAIAEFFSRDLDPRGPVTVRGHWGPGRSLRLEFAGPLGAADRQRARNFLLEHLR